MAAGKDSLLINSDRLVMEGHTGPRQTSHLGGVMRGERWRKEKGCEGGKTVETARPKAVLLEPVDDPEEVVGVRRRTESGMRWRGGVAVVCCEEGGSLRRERKVVRVLVIILVCEAIPTGRERGGEPTELFDRDSVTHLRGTRVERSNNGIIYVPLYRDYNRT